MANSNLGSALAALQALHQQLTDDTIIDLGNMVIQLADHIERLSETVGLVLNVDDRDEIAEEVQTVLRGSHDIVAYSRMAGKAAQEWGGRKA